MLDHALNQLLVPGRMADRQTEARARRLAREARGTDRRTFWLTDGIRVAAHAGGALVAQVHGTRVKAGPAIRPVAHRP